MQRVDPVQNRLEDGKSFLVGQGSCFDEVHKILLVLVAEVLLDNNGTKFFLVSRAEEPRVGSSDIARLVTQLFVFVDLLLLVPSKPFDPIILMDTLYLQDEGTVT